ncbi:hypothetical protein [Halobellus salinisoli]|uniref:hypothetical protein n=1 Tax=Halobellus salinisoli TaxID=3108500 RepID=UPI003009E31F
MYWLLTSLLPIRQIAAIALIVLGLEAAGVDVIATGLDLLGDALGIPSWSWSAIFPW